MPFSVWVRLTFAWTGSIAVLGDSAKSSQALERHQLLMNKTKEAGAARALGLGRWFSGECLSKSN
jgi:hypothetical protein